MSGLAWVESTGSKPILQQKIDLRLAFSSTETPNKLSLEDVPGTLDFAFISYRINKGYDSLLQACLKLSSFW